MAFLALLLSHSVVSDSTTLWTAARQASLSFTSSQSLLRLMSIESVMLSNHLILCHPLLLLPSIFPNIKLFSSESALLIRWPTYWKFTFTFSISPSNEYSGLISFRIDWLDLLGVQGTLESLLQHHSSKASILWQCGSTLRGRKGFAGWLSILRADRGPSPLGPERSCFYSLKEAVAWIRAHAQWRTTGGWGGGIPRPP